MRDYKRHCISHFLTSKMSQFSKKITANLQKMMVSTLGKVCCTITLVCVISTTVKGTHMQSVESNILKIPFSVTAGQPPECEQSNDDSCPQLEVLRGRDGRDGRDGERGREAFQEREGRKEREGPSDTREHVGLWDQWGRKVSQERKEREALWGCLELLELRDKEVPMDKRDSKEREEREGRLAKKDREEIEVNLELVGLRVKRESQERGVSLVLQSLQ